MTANKKVRAAVTQCPVCNSKRNSYLDGGTELCFHCGKCGWTECGAYAEKRKREREQEAEVKRAESKKEN